MRASAQVAVARGASAARTRITRLRSDPPFVLRRTHPVAREPLRQWNLQGEDAVHMSLVAGAAGPLGGDDLRLGIDVEPGAALVLRGVAATLALPGPHGQPSRVEVTIRVAAGAALAWLPGPLIAARGCRHRALTQVLLEPGARLLLREELLRGRHGEQPGAVAQRLRVCLGDNPLLDQEIAAGPEAMGWAGPAVIGGRRAVGALLLVDPDWVGTPIALPAPTPGADVALLPLDGPATLVTALAPDGLGLRQRLNAGLAAIEGALPLS
jgi:urease accessory protein